MPFDNFNNNITLDDYCDKNDFLYGESINSDIDYFNNLLIDSICEFIDSPYKKSFLSQ